MSEGAAESAEAPVSLSAATQVTAGCLLRAARERQGLHIAALAVSMKVPVKKLEALEADRFDLLPDAVFVRALAASVCRSLKIDSAPVLALLPASTTPRLNADDRGINTPFNVPGQASNTSLQSLMLTPPALMVLALLFAALVVYFYPVASRVASVSDKLQIVAQAVTPEVTPDVAEPAPPITQPVVTPLATTPFPTIAGAPISPAALRPPVSSKAIVSSESVLAVTPIAPAAETLKTAASSALANQSNLLQFKAKGTAWVQVTDAKGVQLLNRTLQAGEVVGVAGTLPVTVVVGRVDLMTVELHGNPFDLGAIAQNNVARFEVKQ